MTMKTAFMKMQLPNKTGYGSIFNLKENISQLQKRITLSIIKLAFLNHNQHNNIPNIYKTTVSGKQVIVGKWLIKKGSLHHQKWSKQNSKSNCTDGQRIKDIRKDECTHGRMRVISVSQTSTTFVGQ